MSYRFSRTKYPPVIGLILCTLPLFRTLKLQEEKYLKWHTDFKQLLRNLEIPKRWGVAFSQRVYSNIRISLGRHKYIKRDKYIKIIYLFKAFFSSALNFFNSKSRCSLQPLPLRSTLFSVVEKMTDKFEAIISQSSGLLGLSATTSLHKARSCSGLGQRKGGIFENNNRRQKNEC